VAWTGPCSYVRLSPAYDTAAAAARELGWPVVELDSHHLGAVTSPDEVAAALVPLLSRP
jgi:hypothetical protein